MRTIVIAIAAVLSAAAPAAWGQDIFYNYDDYPSPYYRPLSFEESRARGMGALIRSRGQYELLNSEAAKNYEDARSKQLDNRLKNAETYFAMRELNRTERFGTPEERAEQYRRNRAQSLFRYGQAGRPLRPTSEQLDPVSGEITWPPGLFTPRYERYREALNALYAARAQTTGPLSAEEFYQIKRITDAMLVELKDNIRELAPEDYLDAKNFVEALAYEARYPTT